MKKLFSTSLLLITVSILFAQAEPTKALPGKLYMLMRDSTTSIDVVFLQGAGGSLNIEGKNVRTFGNFFDFAPAPKLNIPAAGSIMWQINGREFLSGQFFLGDSLACLVTKKDGREYVNHITQQGAEFFKGQIKK
jgi:hypothetical protein